MLSALRRAAVLLAMLAISTHAARAQDLHHARRSMTLTLAANADSLFPLFGPTREGEWATGWSPTFIFPVGGAQTAEGAVFTTPAGHDNTGVAYWVMNEYDVKARRVRYVRIVPDATAIQLEIVVSPAAQNAATVDVTYTYTALGEKGNAAVDDFARNVPAMKAHWEAAITELLQRRGRP